MLIHGNQLTPESGVKSAYLSPSHRLARQRWPALPGSRACPLLSGDDHELVPAGRQYLPRQLSQCRLADIIEAEWAAARPAEAVVRRNLGTSPLPADAWALATAAGLTPEPDRTQAQREALALARTLAEELQAADAVILAVPLYNFGVSQHFKTWADLVIAGAGPAAPVLKDTPTVLATVRGGGYGSGTPREGWDHSTPYLRRILEDVWQADLTIVERELTLAETVPEMEPLRPLAADLHRQARAAARDAGTALAAAAPGSSASRGAPETAD